MIKKLLRRISNGSLATGLRNTAATTLEWIWRKKVQLVILFVVLTMFFSWLNYAFSLQSTRTTLSLNYEQAAQGLNPNETRFNISKMRQTEVMSSALEYAGLQNTYTPEALATCVSIRPTNRSGQSSEYVATSYSVTFTNCIGIKQISAEDMLELICKAYKDWFMNNCAENQSVLKLRIENLDEEEYLIAVDQLRIRARQLSKYVRNRLKQVKNYTNEETGVSFSSIRQDIDNLLEYDLKNFEAFILENGIAADKARILSILKYKQQQDKMTYDNDMASYTVKNEGVSMYDEAMSSIVMIPTTDTSSEYYMSRTKTEMDELAREADDSLVEATAIDSTIRMDAYMIEKLSTTMPSDENFDKANDMLESLTDKINEIASVLEDLDTLYLHYRTKDYMSFECNSLTFKSRIQITDAVTKAVIGIVVAILIHMLWLAVKSLKHRRRRDVE